MKLDVLFQTAVKALTEQGLSFAVAGGFAAALYRKEPRVTMDVDFCIVVKSQAQKAAVQVVESLGLSAGVVREADLAGGPMFAIRKGKTKPCIIVGRTKDAEMSEGVDILLPGIPWVPDAVARAQDCMVDYGFGMVPVLTIEDVILSKLYALQSARLRAKDLDDLQSIFDADHRVDYAYLSAQMQKFTICVPKSAEVFLPDIILKISRANARRRKGQR